MRILMLGHGIAMRRVIDWVCKQGHQVCLVAYDNPYQQQTPPNFTFVPCDIGSYMPDKELANPSDEVSSLGQPVVEMLQTLTAKFQPDLVHLHHLNFLTDCCVKAGLKPLVVSVWGLLNSLLKPEQTSLKHPALRRMLIAADGVIIESQVLLERYQQLEMCTQQLALIPLGVNTQLFKRGFAAQRRVQRKMLGISPETVVLLSPRGWSKIYQHQQIFTAYRLARPHFKKPTLLVFLKLGRTATTEEMEVLQAEMEQEVAEYALTDKVRWLPSLRYELMPTVYNLADVVINYPREDAFPSTVIEAVACECPVISARLPSYVGSFIEDVCTLVEPEVPPMALVQAMINLVNGCSDQRSPSLQLARQAVVNHYNETLAQQRLFAFYKNILNV